MIQVANYKTIGMQRDSSESAFDSKFAFENMNMRITARDSNTLLSLSNERGNLRLNTVNADNEWLVILGYPIGYTILKDTLILFTTTNATPATTNGTNRIYKITKSTVADTLIVSILAQNNTLNFDATHPIEAIPLYENENIQKVYWIDGKNQPRCINIVSDTSTSDNVDFSPNMQLNEEVLITKNMSSIGLFPVGTVQYIFTYFNKNGVETKPFYISSQYYTSHENRGGSPEESVNNSFNISIQFIDHTFDYIRIYSVIRTSINSTPMVSKVADVNLATQLTKPPFWPPPYGWRPSLEFTDTHSHIESVASITPLTVGSERIIPQTMALKDNTLFFGNVELATPTIGNRGITFTGDVTYSEKELFTEEGYGEDYPYTPYSLSKNQSEITTFKGGEYYRFGVQAQHESGKWSEVIWIKDKLNTVYPKTTPTFVGGTLIPSSLNNTVDELALDLTGVTGFRLKDTDGVVTPFYKLPEDEIINVGILLGNPNWEVGESILFVGSFTFISTLDSGISRTLTILNGSVSVEFMSDQSTPLTLAGPDTPIIVFNNADYKADYYNILALDIVDNVTISGSKATMSLTLGGTETLLNLGFKKLRGVVVYPSYNERRIITQGFLNPTMYNVEDRYNNAPGLIPSWFLRPLPPTPSNLDLYQASITGNPVAYTHNHPVKTGVYANAEIANTSLPATFPMVNASVEDIKNGITFKNNYKEHFYIDNSFQEFYSPEFEFDENLQATDNLNAKLLIIGMSLLTSFTGDIDLTTSVGPSSGEGFSKPPYIGVHNYGLGHNKLVTAPVWKDGTDRFALRPWHHMNQSITRTNNGILETKKMSNIHYSGFNSYRPYNSFWQPTSGISTVKAITDSNKLYRIDGIDAPINPFFYSAKVEKVIFTKPFAISTIGEDYDGFLQWSNLAASTSPIKIKYNVAKHGIFGFNWGNTSTQVVAPAILDVPAGNLISIKPFWDEGRLTSFLRDSIPVEINTSTGNIQTPFGGVWLAELYRDVDENLLFGGKNEQAFIKNNWQIAGESVNITAATLYEIPLTIGDTFMQRYDCLRVFPNSNEDILTMTEIVSILCETRINLDGRYDNNRNSSNNLVVSPTNYNLLNPVYNQSANYFQYHALDYDLLGLDNFPNTITWGNKKIVGEQVDAWTNISMINTYDVNGEFGEIKALVHFNDSLYGFLDKALFNILYNSRVQINATDGIPIELSNSGAMDGVKYITTNVGTKNKHSIVSSAAGLYFIDETNRSINLFNGNVNNISDKLGFHSWAYDNFVNLKDWSPLTYENFTTHYDNLNKDVYFIGKDVALCYSELLGLFTSFYSYEKVPYLFNLWNECITVKLVLNTQIMELWALNKGEYNSFFGTKKPFYTTLMVNPHPLLDKVFNTFEFRADSWETSDNWVTPNSPNTLRRVVDFTKLKVWDEYQIGEHTLTFNNGLISSLKQKFRAWRTPIPRVTSKNYTAALGGMVKTPAITGLDRLRNNWAYMQLYSDGTHNYRTVLHDINIYYGM